MEPTIRTFRDYASDSIGNLVLGEGFPPDPDIRPGIIAILDVLSAYFEEGKRLYPEVVVTSSIDGLVAFLPGYRIVMVGEGPPEQGTYQKALKTCAPLAQNGWAIALQVSSERLKYGILTAETSPISPALWRLVVGDLAEYGSDPEPRVAMLRSLGQNTVEIRGRRAALQLVFSVRVAAPHDASPRDVVLDQLVRDIGEESRDKVRAFLQRVLEDAFRGGHGCLIGVVDDADDSVRGLRQDFPDAHHLSVPISLGKVLVECETQNTIRSATELRLAAEVVTNMINHDGIAVFTSSGRLIAFNLFVPKPDEVRTMGGARSRAFEQMRSSSRFICCFIRSQDGAMRVWRSQQ
ncbi:MAG: hypothetical protein H6730_01360 [Deltaproteobacteria bacterium]|nr:hypothetical protein [Deltaproteobacteria bacterium]